MSKDFKLIMLDLVLSSLAKNAVYYKETARTKTIGQKIREILDFHVDFLTDAIEKINKINGFDLKDQPEFKLLSIPEFEDSMIRSSYNFEKAISGQLYVSIVFTLYKDEVSHGLSNFFDYLNQLNINYGYHDNKFPNGDKVIVFEFTLEEFCDYLI